MRIGRLVGLDVGGLLTDVVAEIRRVYEADHPRVTERLLSGWEESLGPGLDDTLAKLNTVRGHDGYHVSESQFRRLQAYRRRGINTLHRQIQTRNAPGIQRWRWVARSYFSDIVSFTGSWIIRRANRKRSESLHADAIDIRSGDWTVLALSLSEYETRLEQAETASPELIQHAFTRIRDIADAARGLRSKRERLLRQRDRALGDAQKCVPQIVLDEIADERSVERQIRAYEAALARAADESTKKEGRARIAANESALFALLGATHGGDGILALAKKELDLLAQR